MLSYRSQLDSGSQRHTHIHTRIHILMDFMDRPSMRERHFTGITGIAFLLRETIMFTAFTMFIISKLAA